MVNEQFKFWMNHWHSMDGARYTKPVRAVDDITFLAVAEQERFFEAAKNAYDDIHRCCFGRLGLAPWNGSLCLCEECLAGEGCSTAEPGYAKAP